MNRTKYLSAAGLFLLLFAAGCSSGGLGDVLGGGSNNNYDLRGTVDYVDTSSHSIYLTNVSGANSSMLSNGGSGNSVRVYYDDRTPVSYNGQSYRPEDLERGDEVSVRVDESGSNTLTAQSVSVIRDVSNGGVYNGGGTYNTNVRGTVRYVDTSRRTIEVDRGGGSITTVEYTTSTPVYFSNSTYRVADLERGDEVDIRVTDQGSGRMVASQIDVLRSVSTGNTGSSTSQYATVRGTVRSIDTARHTIALDSTSWRSNFNGTTTGSRLTVSYDTNTNVSVSGRLYPVSGLEVGDVIDVQVQNANASMPFATSITLVRDVNNRY